MYVLDAEGAGFQLPTGRDNFECDTPGRDDDDDPIPLDPYIDPDLPPSDDYDYDLPVGPVFDPEPAPPGGGFGDPGGPGNPPDPLDDPPGGGPVTGPTGPDGVALPGDTLTACDVCPGQLTEWYVCNLDGSGCVLVSKGTSPILYIPPEFTGKSLAGVGRCPDPGAPVEDGQDTGYGAPVPCTPIVVGPPDGATVFAEGAGLYTIAYVGFFIASIGSTGAPNGITVYPGNGDGFCSSGFARPWITYVNAQGDTFNAPRNPGDGCQVASLIMNNIVIRFFPADGSPGTILYP
jgi:hypothetical protein